MHRLLLLLRTPASWLLVGLIVCGSTGCDEILSRGKSSAEEAQAAEAAGDYLKAISFYEATLDGTPGTAETHYRIAVIFEDRLNEPVSALHHYRRYRFLAGADQKKEEIDNSIARLERILASKLGEGGLMSKSEAARLKNENLELRQTIAEQKEEIKRRIKENARGIAERAKLIKQIGMGKPPVDQDGRSTVPQTRAAEALIGPDTKTYEVQPGDTLAAISRKFYNTPNRWKDIADANYNQLGDSTQIKPGMTLIIP